MVAGGERFGVAVLSIYVRLRLCWPELGGTKTRAERIDKKQACLGQYLRTPSYVPTTVGFSP